jgi:hypothetical protein
LISTDRNGGVNICWKALEAASNIGNPRHARRGHLICGSLNKVLLRPAKGRGDTNHRAGPLQELQENQAVAGAD